MKAYQRFYKLLSLGIFLVMVTPLGHFSKAQAADSFPDLTALSVPQIDSIFETFGSAIAFRPLEPASSFGEIWGVAFGLKASMTSTYRLREHIPSTSLPFLPSANLIGALQLPFGLAVEMGFLPSLNISGVSFHSFGADAKWNFTSILTDLLPAELALRAMYTTGGVSTSQTVQSVKTDIELNSNLWGLNAAISKRLIFFEPYGFLGYIRQSGKLTGTGSTALFAQSVSATSSFTKSSGSFWMGLGFQLYAGFFNLTGEIDRMFGVNTYSAKLGFKF